MKARRNLWILLALLVLLSLGLGVGLRKTITLTVGDQSRTLTTYALTVRSLLRTQEIALGTQDLLAPPLNSWLKNNQTVSLIRAVPVNIWADSRMVTFTSPARLPEDLLAQAGLLLKPGDRLLSNGAPHPFDLPFPAGVSSIAMQIIRSVSFSLAEGDQIHTYTSSAATLGQALWESDVKYLAADRLNPPAFSLLRGGLHASLIRSRQITIQAGSGYFTLNTSATTVGEALSLAGFALQGLDYSMPPPQEPIPAGGEIRLVRVREEVQIEQTPLAFETNYQPVADLELDNQAILQTGEYGLSARRLRIRYEDGTEISRTVESEWVARPPQPRIVGYGTKIVQHSATVDGVAIQYWRAITMWATSYHPSNTGNITYSGLPVRKGLAAVDIRYVPLYTRMYVPGYGEALAADIGGGVIGRWIDLAYSDNDYVSWHSYVTVYFLWPPPDNVVWIIP